MKRRMERGKEGGARHVLKPISNTITHDRNATTQVQAPYTMHTIQLLRNPPARSRTTASLTSPRARHICKLGTTLYNLSGRTNDPRSDACDRARNPHRAEARTARTARAICSSATQCRQCAVVRRVHESIQCAEPEHRRCGTA